MLLIQLPRIADERGVPDAPTTTMLRALWRQSSARSPSILAFSFEIAIWASMGSSPLVDGVAAVGASAIQAF